MSNPIDITTLKALLDTPIATEIPSDQTSQILSAFPFLPLSRALNLRTLSSPGVLSPYRIFRSGSLSQIPGSELVKLRDEYGITTIFDLRSRSERSKYASPAIPGIETIWIPSLFDSEDEDEREKGRGLLSVVVRPEEFAANDGADAYIKSYSSILDTHRRVFKAVFEHLRDGRGGVLYHCTAGKDRTGILSALILGLANAPAEEISHDYALTRIGVEPFREHLVKQLIAQLPGDAAQEIGHGLETPGFAEMCGVRGQNILKVVNSLNGKYEPSEKVQLDGYEMHNGVIWYLTRELGLSVEDLKKIRINLKA